MEICAEITGQVCCQDDNIILNSISYYEINPKQSFPIEITLKKIAFPSGYFGLLTGENVNAGVIDEEYRGIIKVIITNSSDKLLIIKPGDMVGTMQIYPYLPINFVGEHQPQRKNIKDAGYDIPVPHDILVTSEGVIIHFPWTAEQVYQAKSRSGLSLRGVKVKQINQKEIMLTSITTPIKFIKGDRIAQAIRTGDRLKKFYLKSVPEISTDTKRGEAGFGSSGQ